MLLGCSRQHPNNMFEFRPLGPDYSGENQFEFRFVCSECREIVAHVVTASELDRLSRITGPDKRVLPVRSSFGPSVAQVHSPDPLKFTTQDRRFLSALKIAVDDEPT